MTAKELYSADAPVTDPEQDRFQRWPFAQRVAQVIAQRRDPSSIVIAVYGAWGEGKTTVLNFVERELNNHTDVVCVRFNPWRFPGEEQLLEGFMEDLTDAVGGAIRTRAETLGSRTERFAWIGSILGRGEAVKGLADLLNSATLEELRDRVEPILEERGKRVVVLVDDIDRLEKSEIQAMFRLVKLTADFKHTAYVLAFDPDVVAGALQERFGGGADPKTGVNFLEKIVQVPLDLPKAAPDSLREFCFNGVDEALKLAGVDLSDHQVQAFVRHFIDGCQVRLETPRVAKRYGNILTFALPILKGEVNPVDLMLIEAVRVFYPPLYRTIRDNPDVVLGTNLDRNHGRDEVVERSHNIIDMALSEYAEAERSAAKKLLTALFPRLNGVFGNMSYGREWEETWTEHKRVASSAYFNRYFSYAIPEGDVADAEVARLLHEASTADPNDLAEQIQAVVTDRNAESFILKLRDHADGLSGDAARSLGLALARIGARFPKPQRMFGVFTTPFSQAAMLISTLALSIEGAKERREFAREVLVRSETIPFAIACLRWFCVDEEDRPDPRSFSEEEKAELGRLVADRIRADAQRDDPLWAAYGDETPALLAIWAEYGGRDEVAKYVRGWLDKDPERATDLLSTYRPTTWGLETGLSRKGDIERSQYDNLAHVIEPQIVYDALRATFNDRLDTVESYPRNSEHDEAERLALQFAFVHRHVMSEQLAEPAQERAE